MPESTRIAEVHVTPILISDPPLLNVQGVHQPYTPRTIVEVVTENGMSGIGETYGDTDYLTIAQAFGPELVGRPLTARNDLFARVAAAAAEVDIARIDNTVVAEGLRGARTEVKLVHSVVSAFEVALLDALGHETGLPVHALLGGKVRDRVEYSGYLFYRWAAHPLPGEPEDDWGAALDPAGVVAQAQRFADRYGFRSFKLKGGAFAPEQEVAAVHALHEAFPDAPLRLDPNGAWSVETSLRVAAELEGVAEYLEDPTAGTEQMARVAARTSLPLATNMCVTALDEVPAAFAADAVQVVLSDHHYWGGLRATQDLAAICRTHGKQLSMHSNTHLGISLAAMTHVAATIPDLDHACDTHRPWQTEDVITAPHTFRDGCVEVTDAPGLGIELDRDSLARLHRRWLDGDVRDRDDAAAMRRVCPEWQAPSFPVW
ncbi:glucarate dehydratase family protein [Saccharopolyspora gregorii]|uniref:glucarate dehydratase n=1 Tax=Saccharopolyspora gregorii TaxID=33914 RepID=A0ABP6RRK4_9PSEU|nr:glucarate dehydratase family protein [Saccharopolyspora gregorii]